MPLQFPALATEAPALAEVMGSGPNPAAGGDSYHVVVYGATASGVLAAITAAKEGSRVVLLSANRHVGGMVSGGLARTDMDRQEYVVGGLAGNFFERVGRHYGRSWTSADGNPDDWTFEPHIAEDIFNAWLKEASVKVVLDRFRRRA